MRFALFFLILFSTSVFSSQKVEVTLPTDGWYQIQLNGITLCQTGQIIPCLLFPGIYTRINHSIGERDRNYRVAASSELNQGILTIEFEDEPGYIAEFYCPDGHFPIALTCYAYTKEPETGNRTTMLTRQEIYPVIDYELDVYLPDWDAACIPENPPAFMRASLLCGPISYHIQQLDDERFESRR